MRPSIPNALRQRHRLACLQITPARNPRFGSQRIGLGRVVLVNGASDGDHIRRMDLVNPRKCRTGHHGSNRTLPVFDDIVAHIVRTKAAVQPCINTRGNTANAAKETVRERYQKNLERLTGLYQNSGASVFPGGVIDAHDRGLHGHCSGMDDKTASERLAVPEGGLDYYAAAIRECFEEAGLLFATDKASQGRLVALDGMPAERLSAMRHAA
eukprot:gene11076-14822_t